MLPAPHLCLQALVCALRHSFMLISPFFVPDGVSDWFALVCAHPCVHPPSLLLGPLPRSHVPALFLCVVTTSTYCKRIVSILMLFFVLTFLYLGLSIPAKQKNTQCCSYNLLCMDLWWWKWGSKDVCMACTAIFGCVTPWHNDLNDKIMIKDMKNKI